MNLFNKGINFTKELFKKNASVAPIYVRGFNGAAVNRHTADWVLSPIKTNADLRKSLKTLVIRSRDLAKNNGYMKKYLDLRRDNIVGSEGFRLQMRIFNPDKTPDTFANTTIEEAWYDWGRKKNKSTTTDKKQGFTDFCRLVDRTFSVDGEVFIKMNKGADNKYGFALGLIDCLDIDIEYNIPKLANGNEVIMGIELDANGAEVAYYSIENKTDSTYYGGQRTRIPANDIIHLYDVFFAGQVRGIPSCAAAIMSLNQLNGYREAELIAARIGACTMAVWENSGNATGSILPDNAATADSVPTYDMEPGAFITAPDGYQLKTITPSHPDGNFDTFVKSQLREIAGSLGVSYNLFASDLETVNFSSLRAGVITERDGWAVAQNFMIENMVEIIFAEWLKMYLAMPSTILPMLKYDKFNKPEFKGRRWQWVDPLRDLNAKIISINNGLVSPQSVIEEMGGDSETVLSDIAAWNKEKSDKGVLTAPPDGITISDLNDNSEELDK